MKFRKIWVAIIPKIVTSSERMKDRWNRWTFSFKTLFRLSRYDFRLPSYLRVKRKVIFNQLKPIEILLKFRKIWVAIIPSIVTSGERMKDRWNRWTFSFKTLFRLSRYDFRLSSYLRVKRKVIFNQLKPIEILLKFRKIWVAIIPKVVISGERMKDGWNRWTFFFKTLFHLSRYDFRLPSYRRVKRKVIFNRLLSPS